ncbi:ClpP/crotonase-like domain-containing protein [Polychytrium aggregatum]|uniref:ClpP/crotonase-like domain-containing protein n=1 Tax=Polychytrium aggregatum TaxID=110093 RepID=UPI0022FDC167|nr:ClpP/crotonase-like domain-containing protein [Polychytrium aggregatum]KAI9204975.1 ClpP/crotonase-like domain-containing protein [Polychytrium aggregatum]
MSIHGALFSRPVLYGLGLSAARACVLPRQLTTAAGLDLNSIRATFGGIGNGRVTLHVAPEHPEIAIIELSNKGRKNAFSPSMMVQLSDIVDQLEHAVNHGRSPKPAQNASEGLNKLIGVIVKGESDSFCSGFDLSCSTELVDPLQPEFGKQMSTLMHDTLQRFQKLPLISIAAVEGYAIGGGAELTTACDHRVVAKNAIVRFVQVKMGVVPGWGGATRLTKILGKSKALQVLSSSPKLSSDDCMAIGLADAVADPGDAVEKSKRILNSYLGDAGDGTQHSPQIIRNMKRVVQYADDCHSISESLTYERSIFQSLWAAEINLTAIKNATKKREKTKL